MAHHQLSSKQAWYELHLK